MNDSARLELPPVEPNLFALGSASALVIGETVALAAGRCLECGRAEFPRVTTCPACGATVEPITLEHGTLTGATTVLHPPPGALVEVPYNVGVAAFECDLSLLGLLIDADPTVLGCPLEVRVCRVGDRASFAFAPDIAAPPGTTEPKRNSREM